MTGPFIDDKAYGTHSRVTVYYSNDVMKWLRQGRKGAIADGAVIIKVMYATPGYVPTGTPQPIAGWAVMVRSAKASKDGWLWLLYYVPGNQSYRFEYLTAQYGASFCLSCHAQTTGVDMTFADLSNITGKEQVTYVELGEEVHDVDAAHPAAPPVPAKDSPLRDQRTLLSTLIYQQLSPTMPLRAVNAAMQDMLTRRVPQLANTPPTLAGIANMPQDLIDDHMVPPPGAPPRFASSDACVGCHDASDLLNNVPPHMTVPTGMPIPTRLNARTRYNLSPYAEWSASLMSRSSRDPVFRAQFEAELAQIPVAARASAAGICMGCHGAMGARTSPEFNADATAFYATSPGGPTSPASRRAEYGALARDGVSCMVCHQIADKGLGTPESWSGNFQLEAVPGTINGPFPTPLERPMKRAIGMTPKHAPHITDSALCGTCHALRVPVFKSDGSVLPEQQYEQTTYLEWQNSQFARSTEPTGRTCVECHMPANTPPTYNAQGEAQPGTPMATQIANIEDASFPFVPNRASPTELQTEIRSPYRRHTLLSLNTFSRAMFQQFPLLLGTASVNFGQALNLLPPNMLAQRETLQLADQTVTLSLSPLTTTPTGVELSVHLGNEAGHKFPTGVGFRRAWLEVKATDAQGEVVWCSGCSDESGVILDGKRNWLPSEFAEHAGDLMSNRSRIDSESQVQIYEERHTDCDHRLTNSFLHLCHVVKDNRLLPRGWKADGTNAIHTRPVGVDPSTPGEDVVVYEIHVPQPARIAHVEARVLYQALPPYYLADRMQQASSPSGMPEAKRLHYLITHLNVDDPMMRSKGWRFEVACAGRAAGVSTAGVSSAGTNAALTPAEKCLR